MTGIRTDWRDQNLDKDARQSVCHSAGKEAIGKQMDPGRRPASCLAMTDSASATTPGNQPVHPVVTASQSAAAAGANVRAVE
jgi:hypothetical protein